MFDLRNAKLEDFTLVEVPKRDKSKKLRCTLFRVKPEFRKPYKAHKIADMPKDLYDEFFQKGV